jgi:hypothetical protein
MLTQRLAIAYRIATCKLSERLMQSPRRVSLELIAEADQLMGDAQPAQTECFLRQILSEFGAKLTTDCDGPIERIHLIALHNAAATLEKVTGEDYHEWMLALLGSAMELDKILDIHDLAAMEAAHIKARQEAARRFSVEIPGNAQ